MTNQKRKVNAPEKITATNINFESIVGSECRAWWENEEEKHILKEAPAPAGFVPLNTLGIPSAPVAKKQDREEVGSFGD